MAEMKEMHKMTASENKAPMCEELNKIVFRCYEALLSGLLDAHRIGAGFSCQTLNLS